MVRFPLSKIIELLSVFLRADLKHCCCALRVSGCEFCPRPERHGTKYFDKIDLVSWVLEARQCKSNGLDKPTEFERPL